ncbi:kinetochore protein-like protein Mis13 [Dendryphion nanum]|uniref:Kinetochore protein-like protein Mis13 n=1 Tax=Dendryphion nanum TaxID=256645 RepID=A0A9P9D735_9PLEO|nr:kinetochore protein-like protein Mis13 [Dendryphion nanum]
MNVIIARSPLQALPTAMNRPTTRRRSAKHGIEEEDAPAPKRARTEVNGAAKKAGGPTKKAAKAAAYDEDDDGFQFSRRTTRKSAAKTTPAPEPIPEEPAKPAPARRTKNSVAPLEPKPSEASNRRRSARISADKEQLEAQVQAQKAPQKRTRKSVPAEKKKHESPAPEPQLEAKSTYTRVRTPSQSELHVAKKRDGGATKIMLPFADTPVITRNKEMRKASKDGQRRSSAGLRGRRASSLIESGLSNALPHSEIEVREFYKYIEQSVMEPRRMKQLLTWCGSRALPEKPSGNVKDVNAIMAARAIQQELIDDFANKPELSDWFSREDTAPTKVTKKPNPVNERNQALLEEMEAEVKRLEEEKAAWEALASSSHLIPPPQPPPRSETSQFPSLADIDLSLLDPSQASILSTLQQPSQPQLNPTEPQPPTSSTTIPPPTSSPFTFTFSTPSALQSHLTTLAQTLEPHIDIFADGVHKLEQYRSTAERVADRILGTAALRLEERDGGVKEAVGSEGIGVGDVLRGLAGVLNE